MALMKKKIEELSDGWIVIATLFREEMISVSVWPKNQLKSKQFLGQILLYEGYGNAHIES